MSSVQRENSLIIFCGIILMTIWLPLYFIASAVAEEGSDPNAKTAPCKDLKPFNNIDELLYQFWANLDSDCLFEMPVEELEKIWGIKILDSERAGRGERGQFRESTNFENKPYESEKSTFFVEKTKRNCFSIIITKECYEKHATLFPDGNYPMLIPEPLKVTSMKLISPDFGQSGGRRPKNMGLYSLELYTYYWLSTDKTRVIVLEGLYGVTGVTIFESRIAVDPKAGF